MTEEPPDWLNQPDEPPEIDDTPRPRAHTNGTQQTSGPGRGRVPPHNIEAEESVLGAAMLSVDAIEHARSAGLTPTDFYKPTHTHIWTTIVALHDRGDGVDPVTIAAELAGRDLLELVGGRRALLELQASTPASANAAAYAAIVHTHGHRRRLLTLADNVTAALYDGDDPAGLVDQLTRLQDTETISRTTSWTTIDLAPILNGDTNTTTPELLVRSDGQALIYPRLVHAIQSEPEAGKSMLALFTCAQEINTGNHVAYFDFEDSPTGITERLVALGVTPADILERFHYLRIDDPIDHHARAAITTLTGTWPISLAVIDGVAEALALSGWKENDNTDIALFYNALPRQLARLDITVLLIDHVTKDKGTQGRYARGGGAKLAGIDGATFKLEAVQPFGRGLDGMSKLTIAKDRPGWLRHIGKTVAEMHVSSSDDGSRITVTLAPSSTPTKASGETFRPTHLMDAISRSLEVAPAELSTNDVIKLVHAKRREHKLAALNLLVDEGYVERRPGPRNGLFHRSTRPFRAASTGPVDAPPDPDDGLFEEPDDDLS